MQRLSGFSLLGLLPAVLAGSPLVLTLVVAAPAAAAPLPALPLVPPVAGESELTSFVTPGVDLTIDWMVVPAPVGGFLYAYQLENTTPVGIDAFTITLPAGTAATISLSGVVTGNDLDLPGVVHPAHSTPTGGVDDPVPGPFPGLAGEEGPFPLVALVAPFTTVNLIDNNITWTFAPMAPGTESDTLFFVSTLPPTYGTGVAVNGSPPSPFGTLAPGGEPLPVPIPEPTSALMLLGLAGAAGLARPRQR